MTERRAVAVLALSLAAVAEVLTWAVIGPSNNGCNTDQLGISGHPIDGFSSGCGGWFGYTPLSHDLEPIPHPVQHGPVDGTVVRWHDEEGWGVLASPEVKGEVWAHFSNIEGSGYRTLTAGDAVTFTYEDPGQDGYPHSAVAVRRHRDP